MTERKYTNRRYLEALEKKVLVFDGAMGTSLQVQNLTAEHFGGEQYNGCNDYLVISYPEAVEKVHRSFLEVGVDVLETDTFRSNRITMKEYGLQDRVIEINETAAKLHAAWQTNIRTSILESRITNINYRITYLQYRTPVLLPAPSVHRASYPPPPILSCPTSASTSWWMYSASRLSG